MIIDHFKCFWNNTRQRFSTPTFRSNNKSWINDYFVHLRKPVHNQKSSAINMGVKLRINIGIYNFFHGNWNLIFQFYLVHHRWHQIQTGELFKNESKVIRSFTNGVNKKSSMFQVFLTSGSISTDFAPFGFTFFLILLFFSLTFTNTFSF